MKIGESVSDRLCKSFQIINARAHVSVISKTSTTLKSEVYRSFEDLIVETILDFKIPNK